MKDMSSPVAQLCVVSKSPLLPVQHYVHFLKTHMAAVTYSPSVSNAAFSLVLEAYSLDLLAIRDRNHQNVICQFRVRWAGKTAFRHINANG